MADHDNDIDALAAFLMRVRDGDDPWADPEQAKNWSRALTALLLDRNALKAQCDKRFDTETIKDLLAERNSLKQRVAELEALSKPVYISHGQRVESIDLRERLVCAALRGVSPAGYDKRGSESVGRAAVWMVDAAIAAMRKGDTNG